MKLNKILFGVLAAALMSASSSDDVTSGGKKPSGGGFNGDGYIAVKVNLPTTSSSAFRAANDNYDDGTANEYKVDNAALLLFKGTNESDATFQGMYDLDLEGNQPEDPAKDNNITTTYNKAVKVENISIAAGETLYGLVVVNYNDIMSIDGNSCKIENVEFKGTFANLLQKTTNLDLKGASDHFFMANAPLSRVPGGSAAATAPKSSDVTTLVVLNASLHDTEDAALAAPAGDVYVERAVAKATLTVNENVTIGITEGESSTEESTNIKYTTIGSVKWALGNTESSSFIIRNLGEDAVNYISYKSSTLNNYRFVGATPMKTNVSLYRTYWCTDPYYNQDKIYNEQETFNFIDAGSTPLYCHENTFNVAHQNYQNTTRAILQVTFNNGQTFYTMNGNDKLYSLENVLSYPQKTAVEDPYFKELFEENLKENQEINYSSWIDIKYDVNTTDKSVKITDLSINIPEEDKDKFNNPDITIDETQKASIIDKLNKSYTIVEYTNGISYYDLRFKHFAGNTNDDDLAPWSDENAGNTTDEVYGTDNSSEPNYLGRYGMVRNNWYDVNVNAFRNIGSPVIPDANVNTSDDSKTEEKWIAFSINILSWAKRTQSYEF